MSTGKSITSPTNPSTFSVPCAAIFSCAALCIARTGLLPCPSRTICSGFPVSASAHNASAFEEIPAVTVPQNAAIANTAAIIRVILRYLIKTDNPGFGG